MAKAISWVAVNKSGEVCLDSDVSPLPRGWERCLDLQQSGVMYLKQMNSSSHNDSSARSRANREINFHKRRKLLLDDNEGEGDPGLQLTLSLPTCSVGTTDCRRVSHPQAQCDSSNLPSSLSSSLFERKCIKETHNEKLASTSTPSSSGTAAKYACTINGSKPISQKVHNKEDSTKDATTSSIESSPSYNASSSSSCSPPSSQYKQFASQSHVLRANLLELDQDRSLISAAGCPHCFMYVIPSRINPKCPRCKSPILVDLSPLTIH